MDVHRDAVLATVSSDLHSLGGGGLLQQISASIRGDLCSVELGPMLISDALGAFFYASARDHT
jgi:hypothetical protein